MKMTRKQKKGKSRENMRSFVFISIIMEYFFTFKENQQMKGPTVFETEQQIL